MSDDISKELEAIEDDGGSDDDYFDTVLKQELDLPTDDDDDDKGKSKEADVKEDDNDPAAELKVAQDRIAELEKEAKGRLSDTVKSRQEKSQMKAELNELKSAVSSLLEKRDGAGQAEEDKPLLEETKTSVEFDEDDKAYVDLKEVKDKIEEDTKQTRAELDELKAERDEVKRKDAFKRTVDEIVGEDSDSFDPAFPILQEAFTDLNNAVIDLQNRLEVADDNGTIDQDRALDLLHGSPELEGFTKKHPGIDPIKVARAFNTKVDLRRSLRDIADVNKFGEADNDADPKGLEANLNEKIKAAKDKPGSLAGSSDQAGGTADLLARISQVSSEDIMDMGDADIAKIEAMLRREAEQGE
jgi:hypothetical protein